MSVATSTAIGIAGALGVAGSIGSAAIGSSAAGHAADTQAAAANHAAELQAQQAQQALQFQQQVYGQQQNNIAPWLQSGTGALSSLDRLMGINPETPNQGFGSLVGGSPAFGNLDTTQSLRYPDFSNFQSLPGQLQRANNNPAQQFSTQPGQLQVPNPAANPGLARTSIGTNAPGFRGTNTLNNGASSGVKGAVGGPAVNTFGGAAPSSPTGGLGLVNQPTVAAPTSGIQGAVGFNPGANAGQPMNMSNLLGGTPTQSGLLQGWNQQFQAPTDVTEKNDPGYQFRLNQGLQALQNSAAARGGLLSGNTAQAINDYAQQSASNEYGNVYGRALGEYQQNYNIYEQNQANQYNRLANLAGVGQTAAGQLNSAGGQAAGNVGNILLNSGQQIGNAYQNAGAATASGYVGSANAIGGGISGATGSLGQYLTLNSLLGGGGGGNNSVGAQPYFNPYES